jgi:hypothetical protein
MTQFHEGQEVEVWDAPASAPEIVHHHMWRKAKIVCEYPYGAAYLVEFTDGSRCISRGDGGTSAIFGAGYIRAFVSEAEMEDRFYGGIGL